MMMTIEEIIAGNRKAGYFYFDPNTMKCFGCRLLSGTYDLGDLVGFLTREKSGFDGPKVYRVTYYDPQTGRVWGGEEDERFKTLCKARRYIERLEKEAQK